MFERFTDRARRVLVLAQEEARRLDQPEIGVELVVLGLLSDEDGIAARALVAQGADLEDARQIVATLVPTSTSVPSSAPPFTSRAHEVLETAAKRAGRGRHSSVGTEHILLAVLELDSTDLILFDRLHLDVGLIRTRINLMLKSEGREPPIVVTRIEPTLVHDPVVLAIHRIEGLLRAIELYGEIVAVASGCADKKELLDALTAEPFAFSQDQAMHVLGMNVDSVTSEARAHLASELSALKEEAARIDPLAE